MCSFNVFYCCVICKQFPSSLEKRAQADLIWAPRWVPKFESTTTAPAPYGRYVWVLFWGWCPGEQATAPLLRHPLAPAASAPFFCLLLPLLCPPSVGFPSCWPSQRINRAGTCELSANTQLFTPWQSKGWSEVAEGTPKARSCPLPNFWFLLRSVKVLGISLKRPKHF